MFKLFRSLRFSVPRNRQALQAFRPALELLEGRTLPAVDVQMLFATTADSHHVTFQYTINEDVVFNARVYRSADSVFDGSDIALPAPAATTFTIDPPGAGTHTITVTLDLPQDASHPYVLVVADPTNTLAEGNSSGTAETNNTAFFRKHLIGVVTHGFQLTVGVPSWATQMASSLRAEGYDRAFAFDWSLLSKLPVAGMSTLAGNRLAAQIVNVAATLNLAAGDVIDVHAIGHSRGTVVNSIALERVDNLNLPPLEAGWVKVTMLDPHAARNFGTLQQGILELSNNSGFSQVGFFSYRPTLSGRLAMLAVLAFQDAAKDPLPYFGSNVDEPQVFYQHTPSKDLPFFTVDGQINAWGMSDAMMESLGLNLSGKTIYAVNLTGIGHYSVPLWYQAVVVPTLG
jgi:hypothetical protein